MQGWFTKAKSFPVNEILVGLNEIKLWWLKGTPKVSLLTVHVLHAWQRDFAEVTKVWTSD